MGKIAELKENPDWDPNSKTGKKFLQLKSLLEELRGRTLPESIEKSINDEIEKLNSSLQGEKAFSKNLVQSQSTILKLIEKELQLVPKNHYRNLWLGIGMAAMGIPFGIVYGLLLDNMAFMSIGLPIGMGIGIAIGTSKDRKALEEGKQLEFEKV